MFHRKDVFILVIANLKKFFDFKKHIAQEKILR